MGTHGIVCPICESGHLAEELGGNAVEYKGASQELVMLFSVCDACGSEQVTDGQSRANKRAMIEFKKQVEDLLTGIEVKCLRNRLGLSQAEAAKVFGGGPVAFSKYENDDVMQSESMDKLLKTSRDVPGVIEYLADKAGVELVGPVEPVGLNGVGEKWLNATMERPIKSPKLTVVKRHAGVQDDEDWVRYA